jgi:hypothetical protein
VQSGLGENVRVGGDVGKSVQACLSTEEHPLKGTVARLRGEDVGVPRNVLPMTLSPRVPAPAVGGLSEVGGIKGGAKRSLRKLSSEDDKENLMMKMAKVKMGTTSRKGVQQAFPEETDVNKLSTRRLVPPTRKPSASMVNRPQPDDPLSLHKANEEEEVVSGKKRTLRERQRPEPIVRLPTKAELNVPSRVPAHIQAQHATMKSSIRGLPPSQLPSTTSTRTLRSHGTLKVDSGESKIPTATRKLDPSSLVNILKTMGDNITLALTSPSNRLSSQFRTSSLLSTC